MRPYRHVRDLDPVLRMFCTYLQSQGFKYTLFEPDYDLASGGVLRVKPVKVVNSRFWFRADSRGLIRQNCNAEPGKTIRVFHHMPVREELI